MTMIDDLLDDARERMAKTADSTQNEFSSVRTGRATPHLLEQTVRRVFAEVTPEPDFQYSFDHFECFSPSPPRPTYRMEAAEAGR